MSNLYIVKVIGGLASQPAYGFYASSAEEAEQRAKIRFPEAYSFEVLLTIQQTF